MGHPEKIAEIAKIKMACEESGGVFMTGRTEFGDSFRCNLTSEEAR